MTATRWRWHSKGAARKTAGERTTKTISGAVSVTAPASEKKKFKICFCQCRSLATRARIHSGAKWRKKPFFPVISFHFRVEFRMYSLKECIDLLLHTLSISSSESGETHTLIIRMTSRSRATAREKNSSESISVLQCFPLQKKKQTAARQTRGHLQSCLHIYETKKKRAGDRKKKNILQIYIHPTLLIDAFCLYLAQRAIYTSHRYSCLL